jgi:hypothetical protein
MWTNLLVRVANLSTCTLNTSTVAHSDDVCTPAFGVSWHRQDYRASRRVGVRFESPVQE